MSAARPVFEGYARGRHLIEAYGAGGWKAVDISRPGRPSGTGRTLSAEQEREVQRLIRERTPDQLKMVYALWTRQAVAELIEHRYGIKLAVRARVIDPL